MKGIWKYSHLLPAVEEQYRISLGEGDTPLIKSQNIGPELGLDNLYFKLETVNPSGSYKDRFAAVSVSTILEENNNLCIATSSGNTGAALAAYSAAAGVKCFMAVVDGAPSEKLRQMRVYGSEVLMVKGFGRDVKISEETMLDLDKLAKKYKTRVNISAYCYSPSGMTGVQTIAYEIAESLLNKTDHVFTPAGGGGLTLALMKGFKKWKEQVPGFKLPTVNCVQPVGNNTIVGALKYDRGKTSKIRKSETRISGLQVPNVLDGDEIIYIRKEAPAGGYLVQDFSVYECQKELATKEGIFCEPAGAVSLAGLKKALSEGEIKKTDYIVCLITGHGFKDSSSAEKLASESVNKYFDDSERLCDHIDSQMLNNK